MDGVSKQKKRTRLLKWTANSTEQEEEEEEKEEEDEKDTPPA